MAEILFSRGHVGSTDDPLVLLNNTLWLRTQKEVKIKYP